MFQRLAVVGVDYRASALFFLCLLMLSNLVKGNITTKRRMMICFLVMVFSVLVEVGVSGVRLHVLSFVVFVAVNDSDVNVKTFKRVAVADRTMRH